MRKLKIPVGLVADQPAAAGGRHRHAARLWRGDANPELAEAGSAVSAEENKRRAEALRKLVALRPPADNNLVIVTHKPNIIEAFGKDWSDVREGEASVFEPDGEGGYKLIVRIHAEEWSACCRQGTDGAVRDEGSSFACVA